MTFESGSESCPVMSDSLQPHGLFSPWNSPGQNTGVGSLLQGIFPTQGSNPSLPHCGQILYQLSHKGSPRILEWVAYPFSRRSSWPRNQTRVSCIAGRLPTELSGKPQVTFTTIKKIIIKIKKKAKQGWTEGEMETRLDFQVRPQPDLQAVELV